MGQLRRAAVDDQRRQFVGERHDGQFDVYGKCRQRRPADVIGAAVVVAKIATPQHPLFLQRQGAYDASMSTPTLASGADFICRHCGAVYVVSYTELPIADSGSTYCDVCRRQMIQ